MTGELTRDPPLDYRAQIRKPRAHIRRYRTVLCRNPLLWGQVMKSRDRPSGDICPVGFGIFTLTVFFTGRQLDSFFGEDPTHRNSSTSTCAVAVASARALWRQTIGVSNNASYSRFSFPGRCDTSPSVTRAHPNGQHDPSAPPAPCDVRDGVEEFLGRWCRVREMHGDVVGAGVEGSACQARGEACVHGVDSCFGDVTFCHAEFVVGVLHSCGAHTWTGVRRIDVLGAAHRPQSLPGHGPLRTSTSSRNTQPFPGVIVNRTYRPCPSPSTTNSAVLVPVAPDGAGVSPSVT